MHLRTLALLCTAQVIASTINKGYVWEERSSTYSDEDCLNIGHYPHLDVGGCKDKCDEMAGCSAINVREEARKLSTWILQTVNLGRNEGKTDCVLRQCSFPQLQHPALKQRGFKSYFKKFLNCSEDTVNYICSCGRNLDPVCAGGLLYDNLCQYECAKKEAECVGEEGFPPVVDNGDECDDRGTKDSGCSETEMNSACLCSRMWEPVCAGELTYGNLCEYQCANKTAKCRGQLHFPQMQKGACQSD